MARSERNVSVERTAADSSCASDSFAPCWSSASESRITCPICHESKLRLVTYVFGSRLPAQGRCVATAAEMAAIDRRADDLTAYVVEACIECRWHHLLRVLPVGSGRTAGPRRSAAN